MVITKAGDGEIQEVLKATNLQLEDKKRSRNTQHSDYNQQ